MPNPNAPFAGLLTDTERGLRATGGLENFDNLSSNQQEAAAAIINDLSIKDIHDIIIDQSRAINDVNAFISGIESDDIVFNVDPQTKRSKWQIRPKAGEQAAGEADLPDISWEDRYKVLSVVVVDENDETVAWDKGYVRAVGSSEE